MKKVFLDTNVLIDYLGRREKFFDSAARIIQLGKLRKFEILVSALSFATASFILESHYKFSHEMIVRKFAEFITMCRITPVDSLVVDEAIVSAFSDFEDALQYFSAVRENANAIITRNSSDFTNSLIEVYEPQQFLDMLLSDSIIS